MPEKKGPPICGGARWAPEALYKIENLRTPALSQTQDFPAHSRVKVPFTLSWLLMRQCTSE